MKTKAIIVDLDGTLADSSHRVHHLEKQPKDWNAFHAAASLDPIMPGIAWIVRQALKDDIAVLYVTGRDEAHKMVTYEWLVKHELYGPSGVVNSVGNPILRDAFLLMRAADDRRDDSVVKTEIYYKYIAPHCDVLFVLEDRTRVVQMWRTLGLACYQVAPGDF